LLLAGSRVGRKHRTVRAHPSSGAAGRGKFDNNQVSDTNVSRETFAYFGKASVNAGVKGESVSRETFCSGRESSGEKNAKQFVNEEFRSLQRFRKESIQLFIAARIRSIAQSTVALSSFDSPRAKIQLVEFSPFAKAAIRRWSISSRR